LRSSALSIDFLASSPDSATWIPRQRPCGFRCP
jgi:hypothetical protein